MTEQEAFDGWLEQNGNPQPRLVAVVRSMTDRAKSYELTKVKVGEWECSCHRHFWDRKRAVQRGKKTFPCKHLRKVWGEWKAGLVDHENVLIVTPNAL